MRTLCLIAILITLGVFPLSVRADVILNEVAWMGTDEGGANCEWIELRNLSDEVVDLSSWSLTIENAGTAAPKTIHLGEVASVKYAGIAAEGYYLMARDSGACKDLAPATSADWLGSFGNGLSNSGAKLILKNGAEEEDTLDSKVGWETSKGGVGGKNTSPKETPQWTGSSWLTASPTPRGPNHLEPLLELPEEEEEVPSAPVVTVGGTAPLVPVSHPVPKLYVDGGPARVLVAGAETPFTAIAYDSTGVVRKNADITWSFGDGGHEKDAEVHYTYREAGEYTAVVRARSKGSSAVALISIIVVEPSVAIETVTEKGIVIRNESERLLDVSGWRVGQGRKSAKLPPDTVIAPRASVLFTYEALRIPKGENPELQFPNGKLAYVYAQPLVAGTSSIKVQEVEPLVVSQAYVQGAYGTQATPAPVKEAELPLAGATAPSRGSVVTLKDGPSPLGGFWKSLVASVVGVIVP